MKKIFPLILFVSLFIVGSVTSIIIDTPNHQTEICETDTLTFQDDFIEIQENENQPLLNLGFMAGLAPLIGGLIGGGGGTPQPPVQAPVSAPPSGGGGGGGGSSGSDSSPMPMIIILVVMVLAFLGLRK